MHNTNLWVICLNCEHEFSTEDSLYLNYDELKPHEEAEVQCHFCDSTEFRVSDELGTPIIEDDIAQFYLDKYNS